MYHADNRLEINPAKTANQHQTSPIGQASQRVLIFGAGVTGNILAETFHRSEERRVGKEC